MPLHTSPHKHTHLSSPPAWGLAPIHTRTHPCHSSQQQNPRKSRRGLSNRPAQQGLISEMFSLAAQRHKRSLLQCNGKWCINGPETEDLWDCEGPHTIPGVEYFMVCLNKNMKIKLCPNSIVSWGYTGMMSDPWQRD